MQVIVASVNDSYDAGVLIGARLIDEFTMTVSRPGSVG